MISVFRGETKLLDVDVIDGKLHSVVYVPWAGGLLDEIRTIDFDLGIVYTDQQFYDYLPKRLHGFTWASVPY
jgi:hypothetical protein